MSQLQDKMEKYTEKVPESVKEASRDKLAALQGEVVFYTPFKFCLK